MSNGKHRPSSWNIVLTLAAIVSGMVALTGLFALGQYQGNYVARQQDSLRQRAEAASGPCYSIVSLLLCVQNDATAQFEAVRAEYDLQAQQDMAEWAKWITILTALQVVVGGIGTVLLIANLRQANAAGSVSQMQLRAYVFLSPKHITTFSAGEHAHFAIAVKNAGDTPAKSLRHNTYVGLIPFGVPEILGETIFDVEPGSGVSVGTNDEFLAFGNSVNPITAEEIDLIRSRVLQLFVFTKVYYLDVFEQQHEEFGAWEIVASDENLRGITASSSDVHFTFMRSPRYGRSN